MVRTDAFIRTRKLTSNEVFESTGCSRRGRGGISPPAKRNGSTRRPRLLNPGPTCAVPSFRPKTVFGTSAVRCTLGFESGEVYYQDAFGRTEKEREFLKKKPPSKTLHARDLCGCGSGRAFGACCKHKRVALRPTWEERSIRERNLMLFTGISKILGIGKDRDWVTVRREITDEKIRDVYGLYDALWPRETNLLAMLPKPDGEARAIYTGVLHPSVISNCALGYHSISTNC